MNKLEKVVHTFQGRQDSPKDHFSYSTLLAHPRILSVTPVTVAVKGYACRVQEMVDIGYFPGCWFLGPISILMASNTDKLL